MSADLVVYLPRSSMPLPQQWAQAISEIGLPVELGTDFDVDHDTGFIPCRFRGQLSGFEYYSSTLGEEDRNQFGLPMGFNFAVTLLAHSDHHEWETSVVASGVLCWLSRGVLYDPQAGKEYSANEVLDWIHHELSLAESDGKA